MRNILIVVLLMTTTKCWAQIPAPVKKDSVRKVFSFVEQMPSYPGDMNLFIKKNMHYPDSAKAKGIQGTVYVQYIVNADSSISDIKILRDIGGGCGAEAVCIVKLIPKMIPGRQNGKAVAVNITQPIKFTLTP